MKLTIIAIILSIQIISSTVLKSNNVNVPDCANSCQGNNN